MKSASILAGVIAAALALTSMLPAAAQTTQVRNVTGARAQSGARLQGAMINSPAVRLGNSMGPTQLGPMRFPGENGTTLDIGRGAGTLTGFTRTSMTLRMQSTTQTRTLMLDQRTIAALHLRLGDRIRFTQDANGSIFLQNFGVQGSRVRRIQ